MRDSSHTSAGTSIGNFLQNKLVVSIVVLLLIGWGLLVAPFDWDLPGLERHPVHVDAIPDTGENQQIVFTEWPGRSPEDVEDQITYPLSVALLGVPNVQTIRSNSMFGFSAIYVIFEEDADFYWSRSRILEKLSSLSPGTLPEGVSPKLGPDATALGQVFWYTLEGRDEQGRTTGGWDLQELRSIQDWYVRYSLMAVDGVAEVASVGGFVKEYQIDVDPDALRGYGVTLEDVFAAVKMSNVDVGARTIEFNRVEYVIRGLGLLESIADLENTVVKVVDNVPITIGNIAHVGLGPALRRGALDKGGAETVGGVVVVRYGENPLAVIQRVKEQLAKISSGLPSKILPDGTRTQVAVVPFYDRTGLIQETLGTLNAAISHEILVTVIVVLVMVAHFGSALLISSLLPLAVLMCFIAMKQFGVDANVVALSGIAIAIGTMVDMGVVICESILQHMQSDQTARERWQAIQRATREVASAVVTAVLTTIIGFLPVFAMEGVEGKLFRPLAFTKTFALIAAILVALFVIPPMAHLLFGRRLGTKPRVAAASGALVALAIVVFEPGMWWVSLMVATVACAGFLRRRIPERARHWFRRIATWGGALLVLGILAHEWQPLGPERTVANPIFVLLLLGGSLLLFLLFGRAYETLLRWCLRHKLLFLSIPGVLVAVALLIWFGFSTVSAPLVSGIAFTSRALPDSMQLSREDVRQWPLLQRGQSWFPGLGKEFMPALDEGAFLLMPVTMPHASIGEALSVLQTQDRMIRAIPEVETVVGKIGRVESPLDPAPVSMIETVINYHSEYKRDESGELLRLAYNPKTEKFLRDGNGALVPDSAGRPFRQWRPHIQSADDIWDEIRRAARMPGVTTASKLQPMETRRIMLQTGMRAPLGVKIFGPDLETIEAFGLELEELLKQVPEVRPDTVIADRIVGKPYLEIDIDRKAIARHGLHIRDVQEVIEVAIGGKTLTTTIEGRERYPVRVRYLRELRDDIESLDRILLSTQSGAQIPLGDVAEVVYQPGPQSIKSEDTFLVGYVLFDRQAGHAEVDVVEACQAFLKEQQESGELTVPEAVSFSFAGSYENQVRATKKLRVVLPLALVLIFLVLYFQFRSVITSLLVFSGVFVAWAGGFWMLWLYGHDWFLDFSIFGENMRTLFQVSPVNLSVAVWVGFLALFGIATDDGVLMATYLQQTVRDRRPESTQEVREAVVRAGKRRIRPCLMTTATTVLALTPVLTATGRGADVMVPMAIPSFGGMIVVLLSVFVVPTLYCAIEERKLHRRAAASS